MGKRIGLFSLIFMALLLACGGVSELTPAPSEDNLATMVAATLEAHVPPVNGSETAPQPAPDSPRVAYVREGNLWLWAEGIPPRQLTTFGDVSNPRLSGDGQIVVFEHAGGLWAIQADGTNARLLVGAEYLASLANPTESAQISWFDFAPGSHWLYFNSYLASLDSGLGSPALDLHRVDADSPAPQQLFARGQGGSPYFSPDGQWIAIAQPDGIVLSQPDGSAARRIFTFPMVSTYSEWFYLPEVVWMNTSSGFYLITPAPAILENPNEPARWWYVPLEGKPAQLAAFTTAPVWVSFPRLAPDGTRLVYVSNPGPNLFELHLMDASTADIRIVYYTGQSLTAGPWSAGGEYFTFWQDDPGQIFYAAAGATPQPLSDLGRTDFFAWVDGNTVLLNSGSELRLRRLPAPGFLIDRSVAAGQFDAIP